MYMWHWGEFVYFCEYNVNTFFVEDSKNKDSTKWKLFAVDLYIIDIWWFSGTEMYVAEMYMYLRMRCGKKAVKKIKNH